MKILVCGDVHWSEKSSIINQIGDSKYTLRIEGLIKTINWVEKTADDEGCDRIVYLGDFFDKPFLTEKEITSVRDIKWSKLPHKFIVGNHESTSSGLSCSSTKILEGKNREIVHKFSYDLTEAGALVYLPYVLESDRETIESQFKCFDADTVRIVFSHNDIKGLQMGPWLSKEGYEMSDITNNCDIYFNGHIHNGERLNNTVINVGNITGQNFSEDATKYNHKVYIYNTDTKELKEIENPYAFNFYKIDVLSENDIKKLYELKHNAVVQVRCVDTLTDAVKQSIKDESARIVSSRVIELRQNNSVTNEEYKTEDLTMNHLEKFAEFCHEKIGTSDELEQELYEICK